MNRISQILFLREEDADFVEVDELDETERKATGFGSTGKLKKIRKIVIEEFDTCYKFIESCANFILPVKDRIFFHLTYLVSCEDFGIFIF